MSLSSDPGAACVPGGPTSAPTSKRRRLNLACNYCRSRKTRCDEQKPSCHACLAAGLICITTDPRRPDRQVERREAGTRPADRRLSSLTSQTPEEEILHHQVVSAASPDDAPSAVLSSTEREQMSAGGDREEQSRPVGDNNLTSGEKFRGPLPIFKHDISSSTVELLTGWLNMAFFRLGLGHRFTPKFPQGASPSPAPFPIHTPLLPDPVQCEAWVSNYFRRVDPVYPVLNKREVVAALTTVQTHGIGSYVSSPERLPHVITILIVLELGSGKFTSPSSGISEINMYLKDLLGRLIGYPTLPNVKALFLLALNSYHYDELASSWSMLSLCLSMATAIGLEKPKTVSASIPIGEEEDRKRTWWSIFTFEKFLAFEMGRQSSFSVDVPSNLESIVVSSRCPAEECFGSVDAEAGQFMAHEQPENIRFFEAVTSLARILGEIGSRCVQVRDREEVSGKEDIQRIIAEKVKITGEACLQLTSWAEDLPDNLRPGSDFIYDPCTFPYAAFLSMHYHNAILVLTRNSLLISESAHRISTEVIAKNQPWARVIRNGQPMVANAARKVIKTFIEAEEIGTPLLIPHTNASLHALYVLAVHLLRHPKTMLGETDQNLIGHAVQFAKRRIHPRINTVRDLDLIFDEINEVLKQNMGSTATRTRNATPCRSNRNFGRETDVSDQTHLSVISDVSMYSSLAGTTGLSNEGILGLGPQMDCVSQEGYSDDAFCYYGMDIGTWIGLDNIRWDQN